MLYGYYLYDNGDFPSEDFNNFCKIDIFASECVEYCSTKVVHKDGV